MLRGCFKVFLDESVRQLLIYSLQAVKFVHHGSSLSVEELFPDYIIDFNPLTDNSQFHLTFFLPFRRYLRQARAAPSPLSTPTSRN